MKGSLFRATLKRRYKSYSEEAAQHNHFFRTYRLQPLKVKQCLVVVSSLLVDYKKNSVFPVLLLCDSHILLC